MSSIGAGEKAEAPAFGGETRSSQIVCTPAQFRSHALAESRVGLMVGRSSWVRAVLGGFIGLNGKVGFLFCSALVRWTGG